MPRHLLIKLIKYSVFSTLQVWPFSIVFSTQKIHFKFRPFKTHQRLSPCPCVPPLSTVAMWHTDGTTPLFHFPKQESHSFAVTPSSSGETQAAVGTGCKVHHGSNTASHQLTADRSTSRWIVSNQTGYCPRVQR